MDKSLEPKKSPWETCLSYAKKQIDDEIEVWKDEVDKLLVFVRLESHYTFAETNTTNWPQATLFSGVAGSFAIESIRKKFPP